LFILTVAKLGNQLRLGDPAATENFLTIPTRKERQTESRELKVPKFPDFFLRIKRPKIQRERERERESQ